MGWGDLISAYGRAHAAWTQARERLRGALELFDTLLSLGMSEDGARRAADLDKRYAETLAARDQLQTALRMIQSNVELVRALNLYAAAEGRFKGRDDRPEEAAND